MIPYSPYIPVLQALKVVISSWFLHVLLLTFKISPPDILPACSPYYYLNSKLLHLRLSFIVHEECVRCKCLIPVADDFPTSEFGT